MKAALTQLLSNARKVIIGRLQSMLGILTTDILPPLNSRSKILMEHPNNIALMHLNTRTMRWSVPIGAERSRYYITVKETVSQAMHVGGRHSDAVICSVILASLSNSYVEGSAQFIGACTGQTVSKKSPEISGSFWNDPCQRLCDRKAELCRYLLKEKYTRDRCP
jgi:hypothetical protein